MKKRFLAMFLALVMCLAMLPAAAFAAEETGSLTINKVVEGDLNGESDLIKNKVFTFTVTGPDNVDGTYGSVTFTGGRATVTVTGANQVTIKGLPVGQYTVTEDETAAQVSGYDLAADSDHIVDVLNSTETICTVSNAYSVISDPDPAPGGSDPEPAPDPTPNYTTNSDFVIENGVLVEYKGPGGDVVIPSGVTSIGKEAFYACKNLTSVTIPNGVTSIGQAAFNSCTSLTNVTIPNSVTSIGYSAFNHCENLTSITVPSGVTEILDYVFRNCTGLKSVNILGNVTSIGAYAFQSCANLTSVTIPHSVTKINSGAFLACSSLKDVYFAGTEAEWKAVTINSGNDSLTSAAIHYGATGPSATPVEPMVVPDTGKADIQETVIKQSQTAEDWVERLELPGYGKTLYDTMTGTKEQGGVFEKEQNFTLPKPSTAPAVTKVDTIQVAEFDLLDLYAAPGAELNSAIFSKESFYNVPANEEDRRIDCTKLKTGDFITTANFNGVYVTKIPYDSTFDTKKTEACEYIAAVFHAFDRDNPEIFWLSGKCKARIMIATDPATKAKEAYFFLELADKDGFTMRSPAWTAAGSIDAGIARRDAAVAEILKTVTAADTAGKVKQLNKWLTEHNQYNTTPDLTTIGNEPHECLAALEGKIGTDGPVCDGYSRAFKVLCDRLGIPCVLETGWARPAASSTPEFHMWSLVQVGAVWYGADITWDDPSVKGIVAAKSGRENENYLLVGANTVINGLTFSQSHVVKNQAAVGGVDFNNGPAMGLQAYSGLPGSLPAATATAIPTNDKLIVDGKEVTPAAYKINNANYFMLRDLAALLNGTTCQFGVDWDNATRSGTITTGQAYKPLGTEFQGKPTASATANLTNDVIYINGKKAELTIYKINNSNYIKLHDLGKVLDFYMSYDGATKTASIDTSKPYTE